MIRAAAGSRRSLREANKKSSSANKDENQVMETVGSDKETVDSSTEAVNLAHANNTGSRTAVIFIIIACICAAVIIGVYIKKSGK